MESSPSSLKTTSANTQQESKRNEEPGFVTVQNQKRERRIARGLRTHSQNPVTPSNNSIKSAASACATSSICNLDQNNPNSARPPNKSQFSLTTSTTTTTTTTTTNIDHSFSKTQSRPKHTGKPANSVLPMLDHACSSNSLKGGNTPCNLCVEPAPRPAPKLTAWSEVVRSSATAIAAQKAGKPIKPAPSLNTPGQAPPVACSAEKASHSRCAGLSSCVSPNSPLSSPQVYSNPDIPKLISATTEYTTDVCKSPNNCTVPAANDNVGPISGDPCSGAPTGKDLRSIETQTLLQPPCDAGLPAFNFGASAKACLDKNSENESKNESRGATNTVKNVAARTAVKNSSPIDVKTMNESNKEVKTIEKVQSSHEAGASSRRASVTGKQSDSKKAKHQTSQVGHSNQESPTRIIPKSDNTAVTQSMSLPIKSGKNRSCAGSPRVPETLTETFPGAADGLPINATEHASTSIADANVPPTPASAEPISSPSGSRKGKRSWTPFYFTNERSPKAQGNSKERSRHSSTGRGTTGGGNVFAGNSFHANERHNQFNRVSSRSNHGSMPNSSGSGMGGTSSHGAGRGHRISNQGSGDMQAVNQKTAHGSAGGSRNSQESAGVSAQESASQSNGISIRRPKNGPGRRHSMSGGNNPHVVYPMDYQQMYYGYQPYYYYPVHGSSLAHPGMQGQPNYVYPQAGGIAITNTGMPMEHHYPGGVSVANTGAYNYVVSSSEQQVGTGKQENTSVEKKMALQKQVEYYFSLGNMIGDFFLRSHMDKEGWVPLEVIASFPRVRALLSGSIGLVEALCESTNVELDGGLVRIRSKKEWQRVVSLPIFVKQKAEEEEEEEEELLGSVDGH